MGNLWRHCHPDRHWRDRFRQPAQNFLTA
jgi:hypothetical protein